MSKKHDRSVNVAHLYYFPVQVECMSGLLSSMKLQNLSVNSIERAKYIMAANPTSENEAKEERTRKITTYDLVIGILAIFSLIILIPIYFGNLPSQDLAVLNYLEYALCVIFLLDFFRSLRLAPNKWGYFLKGGGWLDLLGSIPISAFAIFRIARLFRIVRLLRRMTGGELRRMFTGRLAQNTLMFTLVIALVLVFTISWLVLIAEQGAPNANIKTYHEAVWWAFVTITTVGYGDYYPVTGWGQSLAVILMFLALASLVCYQAISHLPLFPYKEEGKRK